MAGDSKIVRLLKKLTAERSTDEYADEFPQQIDKPTSIGKGIPTLQKNVYRQPTPMIRERFKYAGRWENPFVANTWLSVSDMKSLWTDERAQENVQILRDYWENSAPALHSNKELSMFGMGPDDSDQLYLVWHHDKKREPNVVWYRAQREDWYENLQEYVEFIAGE
jgi:hypothetical protein